MNENEIDDNESLDVFADYEERERDYEELPCGCVAGLGCICN